MSEYISMSELPSADTANGANVLGLDANNEPKRFNTSDIVKQVYPAVDTDYLQSTGKAIVIGNYVTNLIDSKTGQRKDYKKLTGSVVQDYDGKIVVNTPSDGVLMDASYKVISKTDGATNTWLKLASFTPTGDNSDFCATLAISSANARLQSAIICVTGRQSTTGNAPFYVNIDIMAYSGFGSVGRCFDENSFKLVNNGYGSPFDLYVKKVNLNGRIAVKELNFVSKAPVAVDYYNFQTFSAIEPTGTYIGASDRYRSSFNGQTLTTHSDFTGAVLTYKANTLRPPDGVTITDADVDNLFYVKKFGIYYTLVVDGEINARDIGAGRGSTFDDTALLTKALAYHRKVFLPPNFNYYVRNLVVPTKTELYGVLKSSVLKMYSVGYNDADNSTAYILISGGAFSNIHDFTIDNGLGVGNGIYLLNDANGLQRSVSNINIANLSCYVETPEGGTYGCSSNKSKTDLENGIGGNAVVSSSIYDNVEGAHWELIFQNIKISTCDGWGVQFGIITDSIISDIYRQLRSGCF